MSTGTVILAAGESARMGVPKQLLAHRGTTLLQHAIDTARSLPDSPVVVVLGAHAAQIRSQLDETGVLVVENPGWRDGMGGSLRAGLSALLAAYPSIAAAIFLLCDQPLLPPTLLGDLVAAHERSGCAIVASEYGGTLGVPALFGRALFPELLRLNGTEGAKQIIGAHRNQAVGVPFSAGAVDIDTPDDYARLSGASVELSTPVPA